MLLCQLTPIAAAVAPNRVTSDATTRTNMFNNPQLLPPTALNNFTLSNQMLGLAGPLNLGVNYSNLTGTYVNTQYVTALGERAAFGVLGEYGAGQYRLNGTLGYSIAPMSQIKASIERFGQRLPFHFDSGDIDARIHQDAYGARFQQLFEIPVLQGINAGGYWAKADNKQLAPILFTSNGVNCNNFAAGLQCINYRHIAGATSKGLDAGLDFIPSSLTLVSGNVYYDEVHYNTVLTPFSTQNRSGLGAGVKINQLLNERFVVNGEAITREIYDSYQAGISWLPKTKKIGVELSLSGQHIVSHNATPDNSIISLQLNLLPQSNKLYQPLETGINVLSTTQATLIVPAIVDNGSEQLVDVSIQGPDGQRITLSDGYTYTNAQNQPVVSSINPVQGSTAGNTLVTITGQNLGTTTAVSFGGVPAILNSVTENQVTVTTNAHAAGVVSVVLTHANGSVNLDNAYTYILQPPTPTINPTNGVTISGTAEAGSTILLSVADIWLGQAVATGNGDWVFTPNLALTNGTVVTAVARDVFGNESLPASVTVANAPII